MSALSNIRIDLLLETGGGGSGRHVLDLYAGLRNKGLEAHLILSQRRIEGTFTTEVAALPPEHVTYLDVRRSPHISDVRAVHELRQRIAKYKNPSILHAHSTKAAVIGRGVRNQVAACVFTPHAYRGMDPTLSGWRRDAIFQAERLLGRTYDATIAVSEDERTYSETLGTKPQSLFLVPNGVDSKGIQALQVRCRSSRVGSDLVLGFVGRLVHQKNPELFLQVFSSLVARGLNARALVIGDGPLLPSLQTMAESLGLAGRVEWAGSVPAVPLLSEMDVLVHTSRYESSPYCLLEAVAAQVPIVATFNAGSRTIFGKHLEDLTVVEDSVGAVAAAVQKLVSNESIRVALRAEYMKIVERCSIENMVNQTTQVYSAALACRQGYARRPVVFAPRAKTLFGYGPFSSKSRLSH